MQPQAVPPGGESSGNQYEFDPVYLRAQIRECEDAASTRRSVPRLHRVAPAVPVLALPAPPSPGDSEAAQAERSQPFSITSSLGLATWNTRAFFGSVYGDHTRQHEKHNIVRRLVQKHQVVFMQETHGTREDVVSLERDVPRYRHFGSFWENAAAGGVTISIASSLYSQFALVQVDEIVPGRCLSVTLGGPCRISTVYQLAPGSESE